MIVGKPINNSSIRHIKQKKFYNPQFGCYESLLDDHMKNDDSNKNKQPAGLPSKLECLCPEVPRKKSNLFYNEKRYDSDDDLSSLNEASYSPSILPNNRRANEILGRSPSLSSININIHAEQT